MRAKTLAALATAALLGSAAASATVLTAAPDTATFGGVSAAGVANATANPAPRPVGARLPAPVPEPETYALILAGLLFVGLRMRAQRP